MSILTPCKFLSTFVDVMTEAIKKICQLRKINPESYNRKITDCQVIRETKYTFFLILFLECHMLLLMPMNFQWSLDPVNLLLSFLDPHIMHMAKKAYMLISKVHTFSHDIHTFGKC